MTSSPGIWRSTRRAFASRGASAFTGSGLFTTTVNIAAPVNMCSVGSRHARVRRARTWLASLPSLVAGAAVGVVAVGELGDGVVGGVDVALQAAQRLVAALGFDQGDVFA